MYYDKVIRSCLFMEFIYASFLCSCLFFLKRNLVGPIMTGLISLT